MVCRHSRWRLGLSLAGVLLLVCCGGGPPAPPPRPVEPSPPVSESERPFLLDPFEGYSAAVDASRFAAMQSAHRELLERQDSSSAQAVAHELLDIDPGFAPARALLAQARFVAGDFAGAVAELEPLVESMPGYPAACLTRGRAQERLGEVVAAYVTYRSLEPSHPLALARVEELRQRALEIVGHRLEARLGRGDLEGATQEVDWLKRWEPSATPTLEARLALAAATGDGDGELAALRVLTVRQPNRLDRLRRRADLELEQGDAGEAVELYRQLKDQSEVSAELDRRLETAKFRWRLTLLPEPIRGQTERSTLTRSGYAALLYWLVPEVRYGRASTARIASDILDHPNRDEIARVINLGLMDVDSTLHLFNPGAAVTRVQAIKALVAAAAFKAPRLTCLGDAAASLCDAAIRCGLVASDEGCQGRQTLSGSDAVSLIERLVASP